MSEQPAQEATAWSVGADPAEPTAQGMPGFLRGTLFAGSSASWTLRNDGPHAARRVELLPEDPEQLVDGLLAWDLVEPGTTVTFRAGRRLFSDNAFRLRWFQQREDSRYWRLIELPGS